MKREYFKEINESHIEIAKKLIEQEGVCNNICCVDCMFSHSNSNLDKDCCEIYSECVDKNIKNLKTVESAKEFLKMYEDKEDKINSPKHYKLPGLNIESIDIIRALLGKYFKWFCLGNIVKYILRTEKKNGLEDYKKARKYLDWLIEGEEK